MSRRVANHANTEQVRTADESGLPPRRRLSRADRRRQLLDVAWQLVREEGTEALTLGRLADASGVTKPVVYDHFTTRAGLLAALFLEFAARQTALMHEALAHGEATLNGRARVIASSYVECVLNQGREIPGVIAALASSPELERVKRECEADLMDDCRRILAPFLDGATLSAAGLRAMLGAAESLSYAAANQEITADQAEQELTAIILSLVRRSMQDSAGKAG